MTDCGCRIGGFPLTPECDPGCKHPEQIIYCPLHAAAGQMRDALAAIVKSWDVIDDTPQFVVHIHAARAVLAATKGGTN